MSPIRHAAGPCILIMALATAACSGSGSSTPGASAHAADGAAPIASAIRAISSPVAPPSAPTVFPKFTPPPDSAIPDNQFGALVREGQNIFTDTQKYAKQYVGNGLNCESCHLDAGRLANSAPMWAAYVRYPRYRAKNHKVNTFAERLQGCFRFSMNGEAPPVDGEIIKALTAYSYWLATGAPTGMNLAGFGYPRLAEPAEAPSYARGQKVYATHCALCHTTDGQGQKAAGAYVFPPLWGHASFNWGAGMGDINNAAAFIKANMPFSRGGTLSDQDAWDVAYFVDAHERPQDPRFTDSVSVTRERYHNDKWSLYGEKVNGYLLGSESAKTKQ